MPETWYNTHLPSFSKFKVAFFILDSPSGLSVSQWNSKSSCSLKGLPFPGPLCSLIFPFPTPHCRRNECWCSVLWQGPEAIMEAKKKKMLYKLKRQYDYRQQPFQHLMIFSNDTERPSNSPLIEENVFIIIMMFGEWWRGGKDHYYDPSRITLHNTGGVASWCAQRHSWLWMHTLDYSQMGIYTDTQIILSFLF